MVNIGLHQLCWSSQEGLTCTYMCTCMWHVCTAQMTGLGTSIRIPHSFMYSVHVQCTCCIHYKAVLLFCFSHLHVPGWLPVFRSSLRIFPSLSSCTCEPVIGTRQNKHCFCDGTIFSAWFMIVIFRKQFHVSIHIQTNIHNVHVHINVHGT